ncbi:hypothetical protein AVEN_215242-1, partial [Araneus ventricosus]
MAGRKAGARHLKRSSRTPARPCPQTVTPSQRRLLLQSVSPSSPPVAKLQGVAS